MELIPDSMRSELSLSAKDPRFVVIEKHYSEVLGKVLVQITAATSVRELWQTYNARVFDYRRDSQWHQDYSREVLRIDQSLRSLDSAFRRIDLLEQKSERFRDEDLRKTNQDTLHTVLEMKETTNQLFDALSESVRVYISHSKHRGHQARSIAQRKLFWLKFRSHYARFIETTFYGLLLCTLLIAWVQGTFLQGWLGIGTLVAWYFLKRYFIDRLIERKILSGEKRRLSLASVYLYRFLFLGEMQILLESDHLVILKARMIKKAEQNAAPDGNFAAPHCRR